MATSANFADLIAPGIRKVYDTTYKAKPSVIPTLFDMRTSSRAYEEDTQIGGFDDVGAFDGKISYDDIYQGYKTRYSHVEYAKGFIIQRRLFDDDLYDEIAKRPRAMGMAARRSREKRGASIFNQAFTTAMPAPEPGDGVSLCSASHPSTVPGVAVRSNSGTSELNLANVEATRILMSQFRDDRGHPYQVMPSALIVPRDLELEAWEIVASKGKPGDANNTANFQNGRWNVIVWDFLTDSNNWFMVDEEMMKMMLIWYDRVKTEFDQDKDFDTKQAKFSLYERYSYGWSDWPWIYGHNAA